MISLVSTWPAHASGNVGDKLLFERGKRIVEHVTGESEFQIAFIEGQLEDSFADYQQATEYIDRTCAENMEPFVQHVA